MASKFVDNFWDSDITGSKGYEALAKRLKDGVTVCKEVEDFLKSRSKAEYEYGKTLNRLSIGAKGKDEIGGLRDSWDEFVKQAECESAHHCRLGSNLGHVAKRIEEFRVDQKDKKTKLEDGVKRAQINKKDCYQKVINSKEKYENKCKEADTLDDTFARDEHTLQPGPKTKLFSKKEKARKAADDAKDTYSKCIHVLEDSRQSWENIMVNFCNECQSIDEDRIEFLRNEMWEVTNHISQNCVDVDAVQEEVRKTLERCIPENDTALFVQQKGTGSRRPDPIEFESYYQDERHPPGSRISNGRSSFGSNSGAPREPLPSIPQTSSYEQSGNDIYSSVPDEYQGGRK